MTVMISDHSALGNIRVDRILYTYPNGVYLAQISAFDSETNKYIGGDLDVSPNVDGRSY